MDKILELLKSLKFLEALCYVVAVILLVFVPDHAVEAGALLAAVVAVLKLFGIQPEARLKELLRQEDLRLAKAAKAKK